MRQACDKHGQQPTGGIAAPCVPDADGRDYSVFTGSMRAYLTYLLGFVITLSTLTATIYFPLIPMLSQELKVSIQAINLTVTLYAVCQGVTPPFSSWPWSASSSLHSHYPIWREVLLTMAPWYRP